MKFVAIFFEECCLARVQTTCARPISNATRHFLLVTPTDISNAEKALTSGRLEGVILRSQLLVLLQRRHFCDADGRPIGRDYSEQQELDLEVRRRRQGREERAGEPSMNNGGCGCKGGLPFFPSPFKGSKGREREGMVNRPLRV